MSKYLLSSLALISLVPFAYSLAVLFARGQSFETLPAWRKWLWFFGMVLASTTALTPILGISLNFVPSNRRDILLGIYGYGIVSGMIGLLPVLILLSFGKGRSRWLGMLSPVLTAPLIWLGLMGLASGGI